MRFSRFAHVIPVSLVLALPLFLASNGAAQQITYYDFNAPQANPSQYSYSCGTLPVPSPLFCLNNYYGQTVSPSFISDFFPASIDPTGGSGSNQYATLMTQPTTEQNSSLWFSVPQKVTDGFTVWFAFKFTPNSASYATADGLAFVLQNAQGPLTAPNSGSDPSTLCTESGSGLTVMGGPGGCIGYGGIDNSVALELDTFQNSWDPMDGTNPNSSNDNHIALQSCGAGLSNSPNHYSFQNASGQAATCQVSLAGPNGPIPTLISNPQSSTPGVGTVTLADGNVHQIVMIYSGPNEATPNLLQVYIDPPYVSGTHTPAANAVPVFSGTYNLASAMNLINSGTANDSAYIGFTSSTGAAFEQNELMTWTYTPHTTVTEEQPLNPPGTPTTFPFGTHDYVVTFPLGGASTSGISMVVTANTVAPALFTELIAPTPFGGSQCQVYDDTGGNCIVYSSSCVETATNQPVQCPAPTANSTVTTLTSSYNNSVQPTSPGFLEGDPFYSQISSITGNGTTATVTCAGECSVTPGQSVTIFGAQPASFNGTFTVATFSPTTPNVFTFASGIEASSTTGGYLTSNNVQNIFTSYTPQNLDGTSASNPKSFSDFVVTAVTTVSSQTQLSATTTSPKEGSGDLLTATVTALSSQVPGPGSMPTGTTPPIAPSTVVFTAGTGPSATVICTSLVTPVTATTGTATCTYTPTSTGSVPITAAYSDAYHVPSSTSLTLNVVPPYDTAIRLTLSPTTVTYPGTSVASVCVTPATSAAATGTIHLEGGTTLLSTLTLKSGCAAGLLPLGLSAGTHPITAAYSGDANNPAGNSAPVTLTINPAPVLMVPVCGPASLTYGSNYQCNVGFVYLIGLVNGSMTYSLDGGAAVTVPINFGLATFTIAKPAVGTHHLVVNFAAQTNFQSAGPVTESFTVKKAP
jgi:hypothetical protein